MIKNIKEAIRVAESSSYLVASLRLELEQAKHLIAQQELQDQQHLAEMQAAMTAGRGETLDPAPRAKLQLHFEYLP